MIKNILFWYSCLQFEMHRYMLSIQKRLSKWTHSRYTSLNNFLLLPSTKVWRNYATYYNIAATIHDFHSLPYCAIFAVAISNALFLATFLLHTR